MQGKRTSLIVWLLSLVAVVLLIGRPAYAQGYTLQTQDTVSVKVLGEPDYSKSYTVNDQGQIFVPNLGNITVLGKTVDQVQDLLTRRLKEYIKNPSVTVELVSPPTNSVWVTGEVKMPGEIKIKQGTRVRELVLKAAGGLTDNADKVRMVVQHRGDTKQAVVDLTPIMDGKPEADNFEVQAGDSYFIPPKEAKTALGKFKVLGEVVKPAQYELSKNLTPMEAIKLAGGFTNDADSTDVILQHKDGTKAALNMEAVAQGTPDPLMENLFVQEDDVISVHNNKNNQIIVSGPGVKTPGTFSFENGMTLMDAITKAGDFAERAKKDQIHVIRKNATPITVDIDKYYKTGDMKLNPTLQRGDIITVDQGAPPKDKQPNQILSGLISTLGSIVLWRSIYR